MAPWLPERELRPAPPGWTAGPLACPLLPPEVPSSAPGSFHYFTRLPSTLPLSTSSSHTVLHLSLWLLPPSVSFFASDQDIPFSAPRATSFQALGHPILLDWQPYLSIRSPLHGEQTCGCSAIGPSHPWGAGPLSACVLCHSSVTRPSLFQSADGSRPRG